MTAKLGAQGLFRALPFRIEMRALQVHPEGCPAHQSVKDAIAITWDATVRVGNEMLQVREGQGARS